MQELFKLGRLVGTPEAIDAITKSGDSPQELLTRHFTGDWSALTPHDRAANERALKDGSRIFSSFVLKDGQTIWIITEAVNDEGARASTCVLLPEDY